MEHLRTIGDDRPLNLIDTFNGFTQQSVDYEIHNRKKIKSDLMAFRYGNQQIFEKTLHERGYRNFRIFKGDAAAFDYSELAPIAVVLLDIDLYMPTKAALDRIWLSWTPDLGPAG
jgi:hypothetical protein